MNKSIDILKVANRDWDRKKQIFPFVVQIGTGATGSLLVQHIAQLLGTSNTKAAYVIADPDIIEEKNLKNQHFLPQEVGLKKADVLASRYSVAYGLQIGSFSDSYIESPDHLKTLFSPAYMDTTVNNENTLLLPILVGAVDNNYTRRILFEMFSSLKTCIWIDAGNESVSVPADWRTRPKAEWTEDEQTAYAESGWSGQVVVGVRTNSFKQPSVAEQFPDILEDNDEIRPSELSCTELAASEPQRLIVNKYAALAVTNILTKIVEYKEIDSHVTFFHAKRGYMRSTEIKSD
ncbi:thiamine biosynthesis protein ThiF [Cytobacillus gottheilii]|uniref:thiamine biosynthesis protein ThiF n=1 Tax=Cytobacillus gottheilii TaxID=859144 RepID=UPI0024949B68|nr:thiamine biosynthesis protein ThiF [Cytobacillus gottheilii]